MFIPYTDLQALHQERMLRFQAGAERRRLVVIAREYAAHRIPEVRQSTQTTHPDSRKRAA